jgi:hypothetical protein
MKKEEVIARYGEAAWQRQLEQSKAWNKAHPEERKANKRRYREKHPEQEKAAAKARAKRYYEAHKEEVLARTKKWQEEHPEEVIAHNQEEGRKGGKYYERKLAYEHTGLQGARNRIRMKHNREFKEIKDTLAVEVELHHEWVPDTSEYRGMAFVEKDAHRNGFIDVILLLDGEITSHGRIQGCEQ